MKAKLTPDGITLIVVDVRNAYPHAEGSFAGLWPEAANQDVDHIEAVNDRIAVGKQFDLTLPRRAILECARLITPAREADVPMVYLTFGYRADYRDNGALIQETNPDLKSVGYVAEGTWDPRLSTSWNRSAAISSSRSRARAGFMRYI